MQLSAQRRASRLDALPQYVLPASITFVANVAQFTPTQEVCRPAGWQSVWRHEAEALGLCCALIHDPDLLILDEPTTGVDPLSSYNDALMRLRLNMADPTS